MRSARGWAAAAVAPIEDDRAATAAMTRVPSLDSPTSTAKPRDSLAARMLMAEKDMRLSFARVSSFLFALPLLTLAVGCGLAEQDRCSGIAGCAAEEDTLGYERGAGEVGSDPGIVLTHTPKGAYPNDPITKKLAVLAPAGLSFRDVPPDFADGKVTITDVGEGHTRYSFPKSGDVVDVSLAGAAVSIVISGRAAATYACTAGPNAAVDCRKQ